MVIGLNRWTDGGKAGFVSGSNFLEGAFVLCLSQPDAIFAAQIKDKCVEFAVVAGARLQVVSHPGDDAVDVLREI